MATLVKKDTTGPKTTVVVPKEFTATTPCDCVHGAHHYFVQPIYIGRDLFEPGKEYTISVETAKELQAKLDEMEQTGWVWVEIPAKDIYGYRFGNRKGIVYINTDEFSVGRKHRVPRPIAEELQRIIETRKAHDLRLMNKQIDEQTVEQMSKAEDSLSAQQNGGRTVIIFDPRTMPGI